MRGSGGIFNKTLGGLLALLLTAYVPIANAFKVDTHVWIGQEVINDLADDGQLTFDLDGTSVTVDVNDELEQAILNNQSIFRMGNIGPDAFPDIYAGQMAVHPGINEANWRTDDWLEHLFNSPNKTPQDLAFIYGYFGHAAADTFAHTYVNHYAGNVFDMSDFTGDFTNLNETFIEEERHIELEKYISFRTPAITDRFGTPLGKAANLVNVPAAFVRDRLIFNKDVSYQYWNNTVPHLYLVERLRANIQSFLDNEVSQMEVMATQAFIYYITCDAGFCVRISEEQAADLYQLASDAYQIVNMNDEIEKVQELNNKLVNIVEKYASLPVDMLAKMDGAIMDVVRFQSDLVAKQAELAMAAGETLSKALGNLQSAEAALTGAANSLATAEAQLVSAVADLAAKQAERARKVAELASTPATIVEEICDSICPKGLPCSLVCSSFTKANPAYLALQSAISALDAAIAAADALVKAKQSLVASLTKLYNEKLSLANAARSVVDAVNAQIATLTAQRDHLENAVQKALNTKQELAEFGVTAFLTGVGIANDIINGAIDLAQRATSDLNPIRAYLEGWIEDINNGMLEYVNASARLIQKTMIPGEKPLDELFNWLSCWGAAITGIPAAIPNTTCSVKNRIEHLLAEFEKLENPTAHLTPITAYIQEKKQHIKEQLKAKAEEVAYAMVEFITGIDVKKIIDAIMVPASEARLAAIFGSDPSANKGKGLLEFPDMVARIHAEMNFDGQQFNKQSYYVVRNAINMAKLALLDNAGLNDFAAKTGVSGIFNNTQNILFDAIGSIDGNHQWMEYPPPYPRRADWNPTSPVAGYQGPGYEYMVPRGSLYFRYGYGSEPNKGLIIWKDCSARENIFRKLFAGPLAPSLETADIFGFTDPLNSNYRTQYNVTTAVPFPVARRNIDTCDSVPTTSKVDLRTYLALLPQSATSVVNGGSITVQTGVINGGSEATQDAITVGYYLSKDTSFDFADIFVGHYYTEAPLAIRGRLSFNQTIVVPANIDPGTYYVLVVADPFNTLRESDDNTDNRNGNNLSVARISRNGAPTPVRVTIQADLAMNSLSGPANAKRGDNISISGNLANVGNSPSNTAPTVGIYISSDNVYDSADVFVGSYSHGQLLTAGESADFTVSLKVPFSIAGGTYELIAVADPYNTVVETDDIADASSTGTNPGTVVAGFDFRNNQISAGAFTIGKSQLELDIEAIQAQLNNLNAQLATTPATIEEKVCQTVCLKGVPCTEQCDIIVSANPAYQALISQINSLQAQLANLQQQLDNIMMLALAG